MRKRSFKIFSHTFWRESSGVVSEVTSWCCSYGSFLHIHPCFLGLLWQVFTEHGDERHLVG